MIILAMESSAKPASVAVCSLEDASPPGCRCRLLGQYFQNSGLTHSRTLLSMAENLLKNLDMTPSDIDLVAVSSGPGSFTGVRIGVSAAKGMAWGLGKTVCGVSTLEAMACQTPEPGVLICPVMDARRGQTYNALFEWRDGAMARLCDDRAISLEDLATELRNYGTSCYLAGDGAEMSCNYLRAAGIHCRIAPALLRYQTAYGVAVSAANATPIPAIELEPRYLRPSQAEREHAAKGK